MQPPHLATVTHGKLSSHYKFKFSRQRPEDQNRSVFTLSYTVRFALLALLHLPNASGALCLLLGSKTNQRENSLEKIDTEPHSSFYMRLNPTIAWKASPTRTPPPICTSAPFLKPRWSQEP
jgi:hypothetical protein